MYRVSRLVVAEESREPNGDPAVAHPVLELDLLAAVQSDLRAQEAQQHAAGGLRAKHTRSAPLYTPWTPLLKNGGV